MSEDKRNPKKKPTNQDESKGASKKSSGPRKRGTKKDARVEGAEKKANEDFVTEGAKQVTEEDLEKVIDKQEEIREKFEEEGPLGRYVEDLKLLFAVLRDYYDGTYRKIPWLTIAAIVFALLYVLNPFDLIPDVIPIIGYVDDALVLAVCLNLIEQDLAKYKTWKANRGSSQA